MSLQLRLPQGGRRTNLRTASLLHRDRTACRALPDAEDTGSSTPRRPSRDFGVALGRRLSRDNVAGTDVPDMSRTGPKRAIDNNRPSRDFGEALVRRLSRDPQAEEAPVESYLADPFDRTPPRPSSLDVANKGSPSAPPIIGMRPRNELIYDSAKEKYRTFRRIVFDFDYWADTRCTSRLFFRLLSLPRSRVLRDILLPVLWVTAVATVVALDIPEQVAAAVGFVAPAWTQAFLFTLSPLPVTLTGSFLMLLVTFRTNNSYLRFDEARKMWGLMLNRSRDTVRMAISFFPEDATQRKATFARWMIAFTLSLKAHLRPGEDLRAEVSNLLSPNEQRVLLESDHKVLTCLQVMSHIIEDVDMPMAARLQLQRELTVFEDILGGSERLLRTPIPVSYTRHSTRMIMGWLTLFPVWLQNQVGLEIIPTTALIAFLLLGMEEIGVENEEPFSILPLEVIAGKAKSDIIELMNKQRENRRFADVIYDYSAATSSVFEL
eukprot:jgi/Ulvmu1/8708/UM047_0048.1